MCKKGQSSFGYEFDYPVSCGHLSLTFLAPYEVVCQFTFTVFKMVLRNPKESFLTRAGTRVLVRFPGDGV